MGAAPMASVTKSVLQSNERIIFGELYTKVNYAHKRARFKGE